MKVKQLKIILSLISLAALIYHLIHLFTVWAEIPDRIAVHFTGDSPDKWGSKYFLFGAPALGIALWLLIGWLTKHPEKMNYVNLTEANKTLQYEKMEKMMVILQCGSFLTLLAANESIAWHAAGVETKIPFTLAMIFLAVCIIAPFYQLVWAVTLKQ